ncbi:winged helix-turn-helix domain-containing protein [Kribbella antibiotica]|uniref:Winged helix-turn-helix domain-containing protein n=2 Tax=Kribbella antibiotica TaxID=190195 RepID=A0A4R4ZUB8_9ACTN|nr:winged helix-turn-helix domain-containing protein [Kribbella antibiotica]
MVHDLTLLQIDPTAAIAPNADLVPWSRLGASYEPGQLRHALEVDRTLFEYNALIRPTSDVGLYLAGAAEQPTWERARDWMRKNDGFRRDILELLGERGPLLSRDIPDTATEPWQSTGWSNARNVTKMLDCLIARGEVAISGRVGRQRTWDLPERVYPAGLVVPSVEEAARQKNERRLQSLGIARATGTEVPVEPWIVGLVGEPATVEGTTGEWRVDPAALEAPDFEPRTALLSPFDRLIHNRGRAEELFGFEYTLEMYKPAAQRRWGYFALPILHGDQLVGKLDATADRKASVLRVHAIHEDITFTNKTRKAVEGELASLAKWIGLATIELA